MQTCISIRCVRSLPFVWPRLDFCATNRANCFDALQMKGFKGSSLKAENALKIFFFVGCKERFADVRF